MAATEPVIAHATLQIAATQANGVASFARLKREIPNYVKLTAADWKMSIKRPNEPMWHQIVRNIKSHDKDEGNYIHEGFLESVPRVGYRITNAGKKLLKSKGQL